MIMQEGDRGKRAAGPSRKRGRGALENFSDRDTDSDLNSEDIISCDSES